MYLYIYCIMYNPMKGIMIPKHIPMCHGQNMIYVV